MNLFALSPLHTARLGPPRHREKTERTRFGPTILLAVYLGASAMLSAHPFYREHDTALERLGRDGDLQLSIPLGKWRIDKAWQIDLTLDHEMQLLEFGEVRSRFALLPFETFISWKKTDTLSWLRPGGGTLSFGPADLILESIKPGAPTAAARPTHYRRKGVQLVVSADKTQITVTDSGWILVYLNGGLTSLKTSAGIQYTVTSRGRLITTIRLDQDLLVEITWTDAGSPQTVRIKQDSFVFTDTANGQLERVVAPKRQTILASFAYDSHRLLHTWQSPGRPADHFTWIDLTAPPGKIGPIYLKPYRLLSDETAHYDLQIEEGKLVLRRRPHQGESSALEIPLKQGAPQF